jgi:hypothetical protein
VNKVILILAILFLAMSVKAMTLLTENEMSNAGNPFSLNINPNNMMGINNGTKTQDDSGVTSKFSLTWNVYLDLDENNGETTKTQETSKSFSFLSLIWGKGNFANLQFFLIDPATGKSYTTMFSDEYTQTTYNNPQAENQNTHTLGYPQYYSNDTPYRYIIMSGNIEMRDTFISPNKTAITPNSWLDIKAH